MSLMFGSGVALAIAGVVVLGIVIALVVGIGRKKTDWAGDPLPQQPPPHMQPQPPGEQSPRSIDDSQRFREQNRPTDPPPPA